MQGFIDRVTFELGRFLLRGAWSRLLFMAACVVAVAVGGGLALQLLGEPEPTGDAVWWAFLRLTDPGYLGDDEGAGRRIVSTVVTILGYVLFMGAVIAILTQWLQETITRLQRGRTPIAMQDHILVLGLTERTPVVIEEILRSEGRVKRYLKRRGRGSRLRVVVLLERLDETVRAELRSHLGPLWDDQRIILRSGSPMVVDDLDRVALPDAAAVIIPGGSEVEGAGQPRDPVTVKSVLSIARHPQVRNADRPPRIVAELSDHRLVDVVEHAYPGVLEMIPGNAVVSRFVAQNLRHRGMSWVLTELLAFDSGCDIYYRDVERLAGRPFHEVLLRMRGGIAIGVVRPSGPDFEPHLNPPRGFVLKQGDRLVIIARDRDAVHLDPVMPVPPLAAPPPPLGKDWPQPRRVLLLGWNARVPSLIAELESYRGEDFDIDLVSVLPAEERVRALVDAGAEPKRVRLRHLEADYTNVADIDAIDLSAYDNVVILGRAWLDEGETSDSQTIVAYLIVRRRLVGMSPRPSLLVELMDPDNVSLVDDQPGEVVLSPVLVARVLAHVSVRPELFCVITELFTVGGAELHFRRPAELGLGGDAAAGEGVAFADIQRAAVVHGEIALGVRRSEVALDVRSDLVLGPPADRRFVLDHHALVLVLTTLSPGGGGGSEAAGA